MSIKSFKDLLVYEKAYALSLEVHQASMRFPQFEQYELGRQMRRASKSFCANIAEGYGKSKVSLVEFKRYLQLALGSADEMQVWIDYCHDLDYITASEKQSFSEGFKEISRMLQGLHNSWR